MSETSRRFALCVQAEEDEDIVLRMVYEVLPDPLAARRGHLRIVDESGEDYLYPAEWVVLLELPGEARRAFRPRRRVRRAGHANQPIQRPGFARA